MEDREFANYHEDMATMFEKTTPDCVRLSSLPSQYLYPLVELLDDRPVVFFDQLGCGRSDEPEALSWYGTKRCGWYFGQLALISFS
jgi:hypothetical protein